MGLDRPRLRSLLEEERRLDGMRAAFRTIEVRRAENRFLIPDLEERKRMLQDVMRRSVGDRELLQLALARLRDNGFRVETVEDGSEAVRMILAEIGQENLVVKSKSNISKEIRLSHELSSAGIEVVETDLGDRIIQISGLEPVHPTGPAAHLTRHQIAEILSRHFGRALSPDPQELCEAVRAELDQYLRRATIGITGANAIAAQEGAVLIAHNEGNVTRCSQASQKHIVLATAEKVLPSMEDAMNLIKLQTYFATGKTITAHIDVLAGCSYTADIEKRLFKGMHGPQEVVVIFIDSGRSGLSDSELLRCIGCGSCLLSCPVYDLIGPAFGAEGHYGGIGVALSARMRSVAHAEDNGLFLCTSCGSCQAQCPVDIDVRPEMYHARGVVGRSGGLIDELRSAVSSISNYDNPWLRSRSAKSRWAQGLKLPGKGEVFYYPGCSQSLLHPELARMTVELLRECGLEPAYLGAEERCCGSIARKLGDQELFERQMTSLIGSLVGSGARQVITSCPGCMTSLVLGKAMTQNEDIEILHITQVLADALPDAPSSQPRSAVRAAYHDPCELGRGLGVFDPPRKLIGSVSAEEPVELVRSRQDGACCGAGGGVRSGYPELSEAIAQKRLGEAKAVGAELLLTCCPWCIENLSEAGRGMNVQIEDVVGFIYRIRHAR